MALTKEELIASLRNEVRILLHLMTKIDPGMLDYRPTAKQRSTIELLRYLSFMGPSMIPGVMAGQFDGAAWQAAEQKASAGSFEEIKAAIAGQSDLYAQQIGSYSEEDFRVPIDLFGVGQPVSKGYQIVNLVLCGHAAYRTQLFLYLKVNGHEELNTYNLWAGMDGTM